ncbi:MAG: protein phosphatase 2C domain-containing protein [Bacteroidia bacterium]
MFIKRNTEEQRQEEERRFVQETLIRRFRGDQQLLYRDLPEFLEHPELKELLLRYAELQDAIHASFLEAGYGKTEIELDLDLPIIEANAPGDAPVAENEVVETPAKEPVSAEAEVNDAPLEETAEETPSSETEPPLDEEVAVEENTDLPTEPISPVSESENAESENQDAPSEIEAPLLDEGDNLPFVDAASDEEAAESESPAIEGDTETPVAESAEEPSDAPPANEEPIDPDPPVPMTPKELPVIPVKLNLANAKTGVAFSQKIDLTPLQRNILSLESWEATGFEELGLEVIPTDLGFIIDDIPTDHGKFPVTILLRYEEQEGRPAQSYRLQGELDILPDPRKMWKELEPDATEPYQKAHLRSEQVLLGGHTMIAASRRGRSHAHTGTFRDDEFELSVEEENGWYIMAVADGAGSAKFSRRGSQIAVEQAMAILHSKLDGAFTKEIEALASEYANDPSDQLSQQIRSKLYNPLSHSAYAGYRAICVEAEQLGEQPKAFHTTLIVTIVRQFDCGYFIGTYWVGDGAAGVMRKGQYLRVLGNPDGGEYAGQTRFLTMPEIWADGATVMKRIDFDLVPEFTSVMIMTDGVSDPKFHTDHNLKQQAKWDELWADIGESVIFDQGNLEAHEQLLEWLDFWASGEHDDRTIAILF